MPPDFAIDVHFKPQYEPWDQRLCIVPDADLLRSIRDGRASVVTDEIERFTRHGIRLKSGQELPADLIVTATGLRLLAWGGIALAVDGTSVQAGDCVAYRGLMLSNVPNCAFCVGYTNASWTLRAELVAAYVCRLLRYMDRHAYTQCMPRYNGNPDQTQSLLSLTSGYVRRGMGLFPRQGAHAPWLVYQNYIRDLFSLGFGRVDDGALEWKR